MKLIDADKLKAEIERRKNEWLAKSRLIKKGRDIAMYASGKSSAYTEFLSYLNSLQQEQQEADLHTEVEKYFQGLWPGMETAEQCNTDMHFTPPAIMRLASHFYELGLNARKEQSK